MYTPPSRIYELALMIPSVLAIVLFPVFSRLYAESREEFQKLFSKVFMICFLAGLPLSILMASGSELVLEKLFTRNFSTAAGVLHILSFAVLLTGMDQLMAVTMLASHREDQDFKVLSVSFACYISLLIALIPTYSYQGVAFATLVTCLVRLSLRWMLVRKYVDMRGLGWM